METSEITTIQGSQEAIIDLASIERELAHMWRSASERGKVITRACRLNLVLLADTESPELVDEVTIHHPARLITVLPADDTDGGGVSIRARLSALCHLRQGGGGMVCSERIALKVRGTAERLVAGVVRGLAVGGLPVAVIGQPAAVERYAGTGLLDLADWLLVDSTDSGPDLWARLLGSTARAPRLVDLSWSRLAEFRRVVARAIMRSPMRRAIDRLEAVDIAHAKQPTRALLLAGWLGHRLGWGRPRRHRHPDGAAQTGAVHEIQILDVRARGRRVRLRLGETQGREALVLVLRAPEIELRAALAADETVASVTLGAGRLKLRHGGRPGIRRGPSRGAETVALKAREPASLVVDALKHPGLCDDDAAPVLERAIALAAELEGERDSRRERDLDPDRAPG